QLYERGARETARRLGQEAGVLSCDEVGAVALVSAIFEQRGRGGVVLLTVTRAPGHEEPLAVSFPPGTFARADLSQDPGRYLDARVLELRPQELGFLRGRVVLLAAGERSVTVSVPIACNNLERVAP